MIVFYFKIAGNGDGNTLLYTAITGIFHFIPVDGDVGTYPDPNPGRSGIVGIVILNNDMTAVIH
jgi:hypothetical protein